MAELFERLEKTSALLSSAVDQYLDACVAIRSYPRLSFAGVSRAFFDRVASELPLATSYENKIKRAKAAIGYTINSSPVSHINSLPPEILSRIFYMATVTCGLAYQPGARIPLPRYPQYLSHVCNRWRQAALDSPRLWTHVDLVRLSVSNHGFKSRAETFVSRAGQCLLDIHIYEQQDCHTYDHQSTLDIVTLAAPQTRSLELVAHYIPGSGQSPSLIEHCFNNCVPGILTGLDLSERCDPGDHSTQDTHFLDSRDRSSQTISWPPPLDISADRLDALLLPVTHLKLYGVYFPWTHQAYHGLVELRILVKDECIAFITKQELAAILTASPRLKLFHSEINVLDDTPMAPMAPMAPVRLDDLEVLKLHSFEDETPHVILSLLATGPRPLQFSFTHGDYTDMSDPQQEWLIQIKGFFMRSNITELRLRNAVWPPCVGPENVLESLPNLRVLVLEACVDDPHYTSSPFPPPHSDPLRLDIMYMVGCTIDLDKLAETLKHLRAEKVVFWACEFFTDEAVSDYLNDYEEMKEELGAICSSFIWVDKNEPNPIKHWG